MVRYLYIIIVVVSIIILDWKVIVPENTPCYLIYHLTVFILDE